MEYVVTGGAGYIGGHMVDELIGRGNVTAIDDMSHGDYKNLKARFLKLDLRRSAALPIPKGASIFHFAANADVRTSDTDLMDHYGRDVTATLNVMEAARRNDAKFVGFSSSSVVYGEPKKIPTPEDSPYAPISNYGLFKVMGEEIVEYYARTYGIRAVSFRFANITGGRATHGIIYDFVEKLRRDPSRLEVLGDGKQKKSYVYIDDLMDAMLHLAKTSKKDYDAFNIGNDGWTQVSNITRFVCEGMGLKPRVFHLDRYGGRGWPGDVKLMRLDITKLKKTGWAPRVSSDAAVRRAVSDFLGHKGVR